MRSLTCLAMMVLCIGVAHADNHRVDATQAAKFAELALNCVHQEYPNKIAHVLGSADDVGTPSALTPSFYGCYDWHSAVHGHWLLARLSEQFPDADYAAAARSALAKNLTPANIATEVAYIRGAGRGSFERPYGLAWLLQLAAELDAAQHPDLKPLRAALRPLEAIAVERFMLWLPKLTHPIRTGEHSQTAFAFGLVLDYARQVGNDELASLLKARGMDFYGNDTRCPLAYEPSGQDFLSPCLAEADFMRRILSTDKFSSWLTAFMPALHTKDSRNWLTVAVVTDKSDGKLAHLDGLNLSRAWMLNGIASALSKQDPRRIVLATAAQAHAQAGLASVTGEDYAGGHWLASFATYLITQP
ncbi:MAG: DUF2891 domain-containing protein [Gammaproteobacteria bacterium]